MCLPACLRLPTFPRPSSRSDLEKLPPRDAHLDGALDEKQHRDCTLAADLSSKCPASPPPGLMGDDAAFSAECAPSHESSDYGGGGGGAGAGAGKAEGGEEGSGVRAEESRRRSWAGQGTGVDDFDAREPAAVRRASSVEERRDGGRAQRDSTGTQTAAAAVMAVEAEAEPEPEAEVDVEADHRQAVGGEHPWEERRTEEQDGVVAGGADSGGEGYGDGDLYEKDLEDAVAMLDSGGFMLDGENAEAWRSESFSSSADGGGADDGAAGEGASGDEQGLDDMAAASAGSGDEASAGNGLDIGSAAAATEEEAREEGAMPMPMMMAPVGESGGSAWGNLRGNQPSLSGGGGGGYESDRRAGEAPTGRSRMQDADDGGGASRSSRRKHSFVFSETSAGSAGGATEAGGAEGGVPGKKR